MHVLLQKSLLKASSATASYLARERGFIWCKVWKPGHELRVSTSAILRLSRGNQYLLVRNLHRPEQFGPFGGVYKHFDSAEPELDLFEFKAHVAAQSKEMAGDIRGMITRSNLRKFVTWFHAGKYRENGEACLARELREELQEIGIDPNATSGLGSLRFRSIRRVYEGPKKMHGQPYMQFRVFDIYGIDPTCRSEFFDQMLPLATTNPGLILATADEILKGRTSGGHVIGSHSSYLLGSRRTRPESPMFAVEGIKSDLPG